MSEQQDVRLGLASASGIDRIWHCAGSKAAEKDLPELKVEEVTDAGTRIHASLAGEDQELELSEREVKNRIAEMEKFAVDDWKQYYSIVEIISTVRETRCWIRDASLNQIASAQPDVFYIGVTENGTHCAAVFNFKTGFAEQTPSERNWQCRTEVLAVQSEHDKVMYVRGGIIASRLYSKLDTTDYNPDDMAKARRDLEFALWRADQPDAPRVPGSQCRWCRARGVCPESITHALVVSQGKEFGTLKNSLDVSQLIQRLTPSQLKYIYERKSLAEEIMDGAIQRLKGLPAEQLMLLGLKLSDGAKLKEFVSVPVAFERLEAVVGKSKMMEIISIARGKAADVLCEQEQITLKEAKVRVDSILGDALKDKEGAKRLKAL